MKKRELAPDGQKQLILPLLLPKKYVEKKIKEYRILG